MNPKFQIVLHPAAVLREVCTPVEIFDEEVGQTVLGMKAAMSAAAGLGLAAPQVGIARRIALVGSFAMINPEIVWSSSQESVLEEGCLSIPGQRFAVSRPTSVEVEFFDVAGNRKKMRLKDRMAKCAQHEIDHLNGILIIDRVIGAAA